MSRASSVVEVNGNRYDAANGQLIGSVKKSAHQLKSSAGGVVDGFIRQSSHVAARKKAAQERAKHTAQTFHKSTQRSRTLMRSGVIKPQSGKETAHTTKPLFTADIKRPINKHRLGIKTTAQHKKVNRFGHLHRTLHDSAPAKDGEVIDNGRHKQAAASAAAPAMVARPTHSHIEKLMDRALSSPKVHRGLASARPRSAHSLWHRIILMPRWLSIGAAALILAAVVGFYAWQNVPQVAVSVAAARANVAATAPAYTPEGFSFSAPISYTKGQVILSYQSGSGQSYEITQQTTKLDSASLASTVLSTESNVQTSQVKGNTVYIYGDSNNATWINNGIRYTISGQAGLDSNQILKLAGSL